MATSSGLFLATIHNQSPLAERKHVARYWLINTAATAVPLSAHPSLLVITTKLAAAIFGGGCTEEVFCRPSTAPVELRISINPLNFIFFANKVHKVQDCSDIFVHKGGNKNKGVQMDEQRTDGRPAGQSEFMTPPPPVYYYYYY